MTVLLALALLLAGCGGDDSAGAAQEKAQEEAIATAELDARVTDLESQVGTLEEAVSAIDSGLDDLMSSFEGLEIPEGADVEGDVQRLRECVRSISSWIRYDLDDPNPIIRCGAV